MEDYQRHFTIKEQSSGTYRPIMQKTFKAVYGDTKGERLERACQNLHNMIRTDALANQLNFYSQYERPNSNKDPNPPPNTPNTMSMETIHYDFQEIDLSAVPKSLDNQLSKSVRSRGRPTYFGPDLKERFTPQEGLSKECACHLKIDDPVNNMEPYKRKGWFRWLWPRFHSDKKRALPQDKEVQTPKIMIGYDGAITSVPKSDGLGILKKHSKVTRFDTSDESSDTISLTRQNSGIFKENLFNVQSKFHLDDNSRNATERNSYESNLKRTKNGSPYIFPNYELGDKLNRKRQKTLLLSPREKRYDFSVYFGNKCDTFDSFPELRDKTIVKTRKRSKKRYTNANFKHQMQPLENFYEVVTNQKVKSPISSSDTDNSPLSLRSTDTDLMSLPSSFSSLTESNITNLEKKIEFIKHKVSGLMNTMKQMQTKRSLIGLNAKINPTKIDLVGKFDSQIPLKRSVSLNHVNRSVIDDKQIVAPFFVPSEGGKFKKESVSDTEVKYSDGALNDNFENQGKGFPLPSTNEMLRDTSSAYSEKEINNEAIQNETNTNVSVLLSNEHQKDEPLSRIKFKSVENKVVEVKTDSSGLNKSTASRFVSLNPISLRRKMSDKKYYKSDSELLSRCNRKCGCVNKVTCYSDAMFSSVIPRKELAQGVTPVVESPTRIDITSNKSILKHTSTITGDKMTRDTQTSVYSFSSADSSYQSITESQHPFKPVESVIDIMDSFGFKENCSNEFGSFSRRCSGSGGSPKRSGFILFDNVQEEQILPNNKNEKQNTNMDKTTEQESHKTQSAKNDFETETLLVGPTVGSEKTIANNDSSLDNYNQMKQESLESAKMPISISNIIQNIKDERTKTVYEEQRLETINSKDNLVNSKSSFISLSSRSSTIRIPAQTVKVEEPNLLEKPNLAENISEMDAIDINPSLSDFHVVNSGLILEHHSRNTSLDEIETLIKSATMNIVLEHQQHATNHTTDAFSAVGADMSSLIRQIIQNKDKSVESVENVINEPEIVEKIQLLTLSGHDVITPLPVKENRRNLTVDDTASTFEIKRNTGTELYDIEYGIHSRKSSKIDKLSNRSGNKKVAKISLIPPYMQKRNSNELAKRDVNVKPEPFYLKCMCNIPKNSYVALRKLNNSQEKKQIEVSTPKETNANSGKTGVDIPYFLRVFTISDSYESSYSDAIESNKQENLVSTPESTELKNSCINDSFISVYQLSENSIVR